MPHPIIRLRIALDKEVFREIEIAGEASLYKLAEAINQVFGFDFDHAFGFYDNKRNPYKSKEAYELFKDIGEETEAKSVKKSKVGDAFDRDKKRLYFLFDYGDEWLFEATRIGTRDSAAPKTFWKLLKSVGDAPPQYPPLADDDEDDGVSFAEKYELVKMGALTVARRRERK